MQTQTSVVNTRRIPIKPRPSSSTIFKRQSSGAFPSLTNSTNLPQRANLNNQNKRKTDETENDIIEYDVPTTNYASVRKQQQQQTQPSSAKRVKTDQPITPKKKLVSDDGSLRIVTSTVQGMKHWTNKHLPYPTLFEVFGQLDSQVTYIPSTFSRQFALIDNKDRIECTFSEIDQSFSNIDRDVQLRIICRMEPGSTFARCLTIRVANKDEWHEKHAVIKQCDVQLNEDDHLAKKSKKKTKK